MAASFPARAKLKARVPLLFNAALLIGDFDLTAQNGNFGTNIRKCNGAKQHRHLHPTPALEQVFGCDFYVSQKSTLAGTQDWKLGLEAAIRGSIQKVGFSHPTWAAPLRNSL